LSSVASLLWYMLVHYELLTSDDMASTVIVRNEVSLNEYALDSYATRHTIS